MTILCCIPTFAVKIQPVMDVRKNNQKEIRALAEKTKYFTELLITQCNSWLSEEEGIKNVKKDMSKRSKKSGLFKKLFAGRSARIIIGIILSVSFSMAVSSQNADSLYTAYSEARGAEQIRLANELCDLAHRREIVDTLWVFSADDHPEHIRAQAIYCMSSFAVVKGEYQKAIAFIEEAISINERMNNLSMLARVYGKLAITYIYIDQIENAISNFEKSIALSSATGDIKNETKTRYQLGMFYLRKNRHEIWVQTIENVLSIARRINDQPLVANCLGAIGEYNLQYGDIALATQVITESLAICREIGTPKLIEDGLSRLGMVQIKTGEFDKAEPNLLEALELSLQSESKISIAFNLMTLGDLKTAQKMFKEANRYYEQSVASSLEIQNSNLLSVTYDKLYQLHRAADEPALALEWLEKCILLDDSLYYVEMNNQISNFQIKYETAEKELEIERQQTEINRHKTRQNGLVSGLSVTFILLALLVNIIRLRTRRARVLAETNATKDKFFSIISHDLKNPAIAQHDALQLLLDNSGKWDAASLSGYYKKLLKSADEQVDLLYTLLNWAQIQTGRMPYIPSQFNMIDVIRPDIGLIKNMAENKGVIFNMFAPPTAIITGDDNMLATAIRNLLVNAVKFTAQGGRVTLDISPCRGVTKRASTEGFTITVSDTGTGMSEEQMNHLFKIDRQRSQKGTAGEPGSGLGLIVCKELIEKHGSRLCIESEKGKGSRFWFAISV